MKKVGLVLAAVLLAPLAAEAQEAPKAFTQCKACHKVEPGKHGIGPSLAGVYGKKAGEVAGFKFSAPHKNSGLTWDDATLERYLANPAAAIPGNKMVFAGFKNPDDTKAVIEYMKALK